MDDQTLRDAICTAYLCDETIAVQQLLERLDLTKEVRHKIHASAVAIVKELRASKSPGMMEIFLAEYGLTTEEGVALMCLAEALLRVPDEMTIDALIEDKIAAANWSQHLGHSTSPLVNTSTWALMLTGKVIAPAELNKWDIVGNIRLLIKRVGEPVIRKAVAQAMKILGHQFVLGQDITEAMKRAKTLERQGYTYSYDMLGESAKTQADAQRYFMAYTKAIAALSEHCSDGDICKNPAISVKLSALHPRYEYAKQKRVLAELVPRTASLVHQAKNANMGFTIDAEEAERLDLSLDVIAAVLSNPDLAAWEGFGVVVQTYSLRASLVLDWLYELTQHLNRKIMVRLVKGAYWDAEIKHAQVNGLAGYAVFTRKESTDINYLACAQKLLTMTDHIYPQFATHNAHSVAAILEMAGDHKDYEFQRLHGMGEALYSIILSKQKKNCRIYAPVGIHEDLLAYLVRRLLENGANSSFVNQVLDEAIAPEAVVADPIETIKKRVHIPNPNIPLPPQIYGAGRLNSKGWNLANPQTRKTLDTQRNRFQSSKWQAAPILAGMAQEGNGKLLYNPAHCEEEIGAVVETTPAQIEEALVNAEEAAQQWRQTPLKERAQCLVQISHLYEAHFAELVALACREAGKTLLDGIAEVREAVDFCRYYAIRAQLLFEEEVEGRGVFACISPWNFPLAIFTGQVSAALVTGNAVLAKPAEQTPLIAAKAVELMLQAGIPGDVLQLLPGSGESVGAKLVSDSRIAGVCFTGSTETAQIIHRAMAQYLAPESPLVAETGGLNAMIVDSSALPEQVVRDVIASAFQSTGQRCSALRVLYLQKDIAHKVLEMLKGAMAELEIGDPWLLQTDLGPVIDQEARRRIEAHCQQLEAEGRLLKKIELSPSLSQANFVAPRIYRIASIEELQQEIFGPILHVATFEIGHLEKVVQTINGSGYGLTLGMHSRVNHRVQRVSELAQVGNLYVNRNQIGAVVGVQPFGGEGLSGTGPKAGGPHYLYSFVQKKHRSFVLGDKEAQQARLPEDFAFNERLTETLKTVKTEQILWDQNLARRVWMNAAVEHTSEVVAFTLTTALQITKDHELLPLDLLGPTGESNQLFLHGRGVFLCLGGDALVWAAMALLTGNGALIAEGPLESEEFVEQMHQQGLPQGLLKIVPSPFHLSVIPHLPEFAGMAVTASQYPLSQIRKLLAERSGAVLPLITQKDDWRKFFTERALCVDTTASGGNPTLLAAAAISAQ